MLRSVTLMCCVVLILCSVRGPSFALAVSDDEHETFTAPAPPTLFRGGAAVHEPSRRAAKLVTDWSGDSLDAAAGAAVGTAGGFMAGSVVRMAVLSAVGTLPFLGAHAAVAIVLAKLAISGGVITVHWDRLRRFRPPGWLRRLLDIDGDGELSGADLGQGMRTGLSKLGLRTRCAPAAQVCDEWPPELQWGGARFSQHAASGGALGAAVGFAKGLGLV